MTAPPRCILNAQPPAAVAARHIIGHFLPGAVFGALAEALPDRVIAEGAANIWNLQFTGHDRAESRSPTCGFLCGAPAPTDKDGLHATAFPSGISGVPAEVIEQLDSDLCCANARFAPIRREREIPRRVRPDARGRGAYGP